MGYLRRVGDAILQALGDRIGRTASGRAVAIQAALLFAFASGAWAIASPLGSVPDEPAHFVRAAAAADGEFDLEPAPGRPGLETARVSEYVDHVYARTCYAFKPGLPANCPEIKDLRNSEQVVDSVTSAGLNAPGFYVLVGWPTNVLTGDAALYGVRLVSVVVGSIVWGWAVAALVLVRRSVTPIVMTICAATPMLQYLVGSANPNGLEVIGALAVFAGFAQLLTLPQPFRSNLASAGGLLIVGSALATGARSYGLLWLPVGFLAACIVGRAGLRTAARRVSTWVVLGAAALPALVAVSWYFSQQDDAATGEIRSPMSPLAAARQIVVHWPAYAKGYVGIFGWLDTSLPEPIYALYMVAFAEVALVAVVLSGRLQRALALGFWVLVLVIPVVSQALLAPSVGFIWQGRYALAAVVVGLFLASALRGERHAMESSPRRAAVAIMSVIAMLAAASVVAFIVALRRYGVGEGYSYADLARSANWQPPGGWIPITLVYASTVVVWACWASWAAVRVTFGRDAAPAIGSTDGLHQISENVESSSTSELAVVPADRRRPNARHAKDAGAR